MEIQEFRAAGLKIPDNWADPIIQSKLSELVQQEPLISLLQPSSSGAFYIYFGLKSSIIQEGTMWLTERSSGTRNSPGRSRPALRNQDDSLISPARLYEHGWETKVLDSGRNPLNYCKLEKALHVYCMDTLRLQFVRHLQRKRGGATYKDYDVEREFAVAITFNLNGFHPFKLIE